MKYIPCVLLLFNKFIHVKIFEFEYIKTAIEQNKVNVKKNQNKSTQ